MMATTHVFAGLAVVAPVAHAVPELATPLAAGAVLGGLAPDFDLVLEHRQSLHFPVAGLPIAALAVVVALAVPSSPVVAGGLAVSLGYVLVRRRLVAWLPGWLE